MLSAAGMSNRYTIPYSNVSVVTPVNTANDVDSASRLSTDQVKPVECQTCKNRKYVDGSDDPNVSFKTPGHIDPGQSYGKVMAHEQEHMADARSKTAGSDAQLVSASITLRIGVCPECGRTYVAGGTTNTTIKYNKDNPYDQGRKTLEGSFLAGQNIDEAV